MHLKRNLTCGLYIWLPGHCYPGKAPISRKQNKNKLLNTIYRQTIAKTDSCGTIIDKLTRQNIARKQALQLGESRDVTREQHAKEDASRKGAKERDNLQRSQLNFHFHPGNSRKPQSVKTVTGNNNNVSAVCQLPSLGQTERASYPKVVRSRSRKKYNFAQKQDYQKKTIGVDILVWIVAYKLSRIYNIPWIQRRHVASKPLHYF